MVKIKEIPISDRPIERLLQKGSDALSNEELLAILLRTGTKGNSSKELATHILKQIQNIHELGDITLENLLKIDGIGPSKAAIIISAVELGKRIHRSVDQISHQNGNNPETYF